MRSALFISHCRQARISLKLHFDQAVQSSLIWYGTPQNNKPWSGLPFHHRPFRYLVGGIYARWRQPWHHSSATKWSPPINLTKKKQKQPWFFTVVVEEIFKHGRCCVCPSFLICRLEVTILSTNQRTAVCLAPPFRSDQCFATPMEEWPTNRMVQMCCFGAIHNTGLSKRK